MNALSYMEGVYFLQKVMHRTRINKILETFVRFVCRYWYELHVFHIHGHGDVWTVTVKVTDTVTVTSHTWIDGHGHGDKSHLNRTVTVTVMVTVTSHTWIVSAYLLTSQKLKIGIHTYIHAYTVHVCAYMYMQICTRGHPNVDRGTHTHTHTHTHIYIDIYIYDIHVCIEA